MYLQLAQSFLMNMFNVLLLCACLYCCMFSLHSSDLHLRRFGTMERCVHVLTDRSEYSNRFSSFLWINFNFDKLPPTAFPRHTAPAPFIVLYYGCMLHWDASVCGVMTGFLRCGLWLLILDGPSFQATGCSLLLHRL